MQRTHLPDAIAFGEGLIGQVTVLGGDAAGTPAGLVFLDDRRDESGSGHDVGDASSGSERGAERSLAMRITGASGIRRQQDTAIFSPLVGFTVLRLMIP